MLSSGGRTRIHFRCCMLNTNPFAWHVTSTRREHCQVCPVCCGDHGSAGRGGQQEEQQHTRNESSRGRGEELTQGMLCKWSRDTSKILEFISNAALPVSRIHPPQRTLQTKHVQTPVLLFIFCISPCTYERKWPKYSSENTHRLTS